MRFESTPPGTRTHSPVHDIFKHARTKSHPMKHSSRIKPRRWPLVVRFVKGAIHSMIVVPVLLHAAFACIVVSGLKYTDRDISVPSTIISSLSIVVGLMLVFRNQTSWNRFWDGRNNLTTITTCIRNLCRVFLTCSYINDENLDVAERADVDRIIRVLVAIPFAVKNHLRAEWGAAFAPVVNKDIEESGNYNITPRLNPEYENLLPPGLKGHEEEGLGLPLQLAYMIEAFITRGVSRGWFNAPQSSQLTAQVNTLVSAYGKMETIRITPLPIALLIHQKQVLALFGCVLPFAMFEAMGWWTIFLVSLVTFTLYGIEGIGSQLEDPFGHDRNDIKMNAIVEDSRVEVFALLDEWKRTVYRGEQSNVKGEMFYDAALLPAGATPPN